MITFILIQGFYEIKKMNNKDQEGSFYVFLSSTLNRTGTLRYPISKDKTLKGNWRVSLRELSYKRQQFEDFVREPIYFIVLTNDDTLYRRVYTDDACKEYRKMLCSLDTSELWGSDHGFKRCVIFTRQETNEKECNQVLSTPEGYLDLDMYHRWINWSLTGLGTGLKGGNFQIKHGRVIIYPGGESGTATKLPKKTVIIPFFGPQTRKKLGYPEYDSPEFSEMVRLLSKDTNVWSKKFGIAKLLITSSID